MLTLSIAPPASAQVAVDTSEGWVAPASGLSEAWAPSVDAPGRAEIDRDAAKADAEARWADRDRSKLAEAPAAASSVFDAPVAAPGYGSLPSFSFETFQLGSGTTAQVNLANGNLLVTTTDYSLASGSDTLTLSRYYNGLEAKTWSIGDEAVELVWASDVAFITANGARAEFPYPDNPISGGLQYTSRSPGFPGDLVDTTCECQLWEIVMDGTDEVFGFENAQGWKVRYHGARNGLDLNPEGSYYSTANPLTFTRTAGNVTSVSDYAGRDVEYDWSANLDGVELPDGSAASYTYDSAGRLETIVLPGPSNDPVTTTFSYDTDDRVTSVARESFSDTWGAASDATTQFAYSSGSTVVTDPRSNASTYAVDSSGRVTSATNALGSVRSQTWTASGDVEKTTDAFATSSAPGNDTTYSYDAAGNRTGVQVPTGAATQALYGAGVSCGTAGSVSGPTHQPSCTVDSAGNTRHTTYDTVGNLLSTTDTTSGGTGAVTHTYDRHSVFGTQCDGYTGQVCSSTDGEGNVTDYWYDGNGNVETVTPPAPAGATSYAYDAVNRLTSVTDGNGDTTSYTYDAADRVIETEYDNGDTVTFYYNQNGTLAAQVDDGAEVAVSYEYDSFGRQTRQEIDAYATAASPTTVTYAYDAAGNLIEFADAGGETEYLYDAANQLTVLMQPGGLCPTSGAPAAGSGCVTFEYDVNGAETKRTLPGGATVETIYDASGRPTQILAKDATAATAVDIGYSFALGTDDQTVIHSRTSTKEEGITPGAVTTYQYDSLNRLVSAAETAGATATASWAYGYDDAGNRTSQQRAGTTGATAGTINYTYNDANQLTSATGDTTTWTYDGAGNQTRNGTTGFTTAYGDRLQAVQLGGAAQTYIGQGNSFQIGAGTTALTPTALGNTQSSTGSATTSYTRGPDGGAVGIDAGTAGYYVRDAIGSVVGIFDENGAFAGGYSYSPYGETRAASTGTLAAQNDLRYIGERYDPATQLYKFGARYYDPAQGRFTQMDPSGQEASPYGYAGCNPINAVDPSGLVSEGCVWDLLGVYGGAVAAAQTISILIGALSGGIGLVVGSIVTVLFIVQVTGVGFDVASAVQSCA